MAPVYPESRRLLADLGQRIQLARKRRRMSLIAFSQRIGVARETVRRVEEGDPAVSVGTLVRALAVLGLDADLAAVAQDDPVGRRLQDTYASIRQRPGAALP